MLRMIYGTDPHWSVHYWRLHS